MGQACTEIKKIKNNERKKSENRKEKKYTI
jgi:hypothetical protein